MIGSGEKSNKFFLNLQKTHASQGLSCAVVKNEKEINDSVEINTELQNFYEKLFTDNLSISKQNIVSLLEDLPVPKLHEELVIKCEHETTKSELLKSLKLKKNDKSPGNEVSKKSFVKPFGKKLKPLFSTQYENIF